jgi:hypothetical protein
MFACLATVIFCLLSTLMLSKKKIFEIRFNNLLVPGLGAVFEPGSVRSGSEHGSASWTNETHPHKLHGNYRGTVYNYFNVQSFTGVSAHRDPLPHRLSVVRTNETYSHKIYGSYRGTVYNYFYHLCRIKDDESRGCLGLGSEPDPGSGTDPVLNFTSKLKKFSRI